MKQYNTKRNSLCLCITTYKRWEVIKDFLERCASDYLDAGIDIYIFDSSDDNETKHVLNKWENENKDRVYYIRMPSELHANMKVYKIWQFYGMAKQYDFIWMSGDALQLSKHAIETIIENLKSDYDMIELDVFDRREIGYRLYTQPNELFIENAWKMTLFGTVILNTQTFLSDVDWNYYETKYSQPRLINYSHVSFYFNRAAELKDFQCIRLPLFKETTGSKYKKESGWKRDTFSVICEGWVTTIKELPSVYSNKKAVIMDLGPNSILRNKYSFLNLKKDGIYNAHVFWKYFWTWKAVCNVKYRDLLIIALTNKKNEKMIQKLENFKLSYKIYIFKRKYRCLYLYGAGFVGERYGKYLSQNGIEYEGYVVTKASDGRKILNDHKIIEIEELKKNDDVGIVVAVSERLSGEVINQLKERGYKNQIYYNYELCNWLLYAE